MKHIVRAGAQVARVGRSFTGTYALLELDDEAEGKMLLLPDEARDLAARLRGVADAITEEERRRAAADPRQLRMEL